MNKCEAGLLAAAGCLFFVPHPDLVRRLALMARPLGTARRHSAESQQRGCTSLEHGTSHSRPAQVFAQKQERKNPKGFLTVADDILKRIWPIATPTETSDTSNALARVMVLKSCSRVRCALDGAIS